MTIDNIALVRAIDYIPFDGMLHPISCTPYLKLSTNQFTFKIYDLLNEMGVLPKYDYSRWSEEGYIEKMDQERINIAKTFYPYSSDYNSMVLFALNGLCPDDSKHGFGNNTFSNKKVAVIEPLKPHIDQVISLVPTDTSLKGDVVLSNEAILLIEEDLYDSLNDEQKEVLNSKNFAVKTFTGTLKEAIKNELRMSSKYTAEDLSLQGETRGVKDSPTSDELKMTIDNIAMQYGLLQMKFFDILQATDDTLPKYGEYCDEVKNIMIVDHYFLARFLVKLVTDFLNKPEMAEYVTKECDYEYCINDVYTWLKEKVQIVGVEELRRFIDSYNEELELELLSGTLPTPDEIILESKKKKM